MSLGVAAALRVGSEAAATVDRHSTKDGYNRRMAARLIRSWAIALLVVAPAAAQVTVTYIANEGFLLAAGEQKVLVDALFDQGIVGYGQIPQEMRPELESGTGRFAGVDLVLATHFHRDHFAAGAVTRFLAAVPEAAFLSTEQAAEALADAPPAVRSRVHGLLPEEGQRASFSHRGIEIEVLNLHHGRGRTPPVQNLGFLIRLGGLTILHVGDTEATGDEFRPYELGADAVDLALLPSWFANSERWETVVESQIRPRHTALMHLMTPSAPASWLGGAASVDEIRAGYRARHPRSRLFLRPLDSETYAPVAEPPSAN